MSIENAKALYSRLLADEKFRSKLEQTTSYLERIQILQSAGFSCTSTELNIAKNEMLKFAERNQELSEIGQEKIFGGNSLEFVLNHFNDYLFSDLKYTQSR